MEPAEVIYNPEPESHPASRAQSVLRTHESTLLKNPAVTGFGTTINPTGEECIVLYIRSAQDARRLPRILDGVEVQTAVTGEIDAL